ncbi:MAG: hypothetical protein ACOX9C_01685 [Kiritimatiellia bacterium]|jgi:hypothetical protein
MDCRNAYREVKMKKRLLKLMVRFSVPISVLSMFGGLSGCGKAPTSNSNDGQPAEDPLLPEGGDIVILEEGSEEPAAANGENPVAAENESPRIFPGIIVSPED